MQNKLKNDEEFILTSKDSDDYVSFNQLKDFFMKSLYSNSMIKDSELLIEFGGNDFVLNKELQDAISDLKYYNVEIRNNVEIQDSEQASPTKSLQIIKYQSALANHVKSLLESELSLLKKYSKIKFSFYVALAQIVSIIIICTLIFLEENIWMLIGLSIGVAAQGFCSIFLMIRYVFHERLLANKNSDTISKLEKEILKNIS